MNERVKFNQTDQNLSKFQNLVIMPILFTYLLLYLLLPISLFLPLFIYFSIFSPFVYFSPFLTLMSKGSMELFHALPKRFYLPQGVPLELHPICSRQCPMTFFGLQALLQDLQVLHV